jgi:hypothetical protein
MLNLVYEDPCLLMFSGDISPRVGRRGVGCTCDGGFDCAKLPLTSLVAHAETFSPLKQFL